MPHDKYTAFSSLEKDKCLTVLKKVKDYFAEKQSRQKK